MRRLVLVLVLLLAAPAAAAPNGTIVASQGGYDLYARHGKGDAICLSLLGTDEGSSDSGCEPVFSAFSPAMTFSYRSGMPIGLAVPASVVRGTSGKEAFETVAVEGFDVRFALVTPPRGDGILRFYDADGALVGASGGPRLPRPGGGRLVLRARTVAVRLRRELELEPTPLDFDRTVPGTCLTVGVGSSSSEGCTLDENLADFVVSVTPACAPGRSVISGVTAGGVRRVRAVLGDGSRFVASTRSVAPGVRLVVASLPRGLAVRSLEGLGSGGRVVAHRTVGQPPGGLRCPRDDDGDFVTAYASDLSGHRLHPTAAPVVVATAARRDLRVADGSGLTLCSSLQPRRSFDCAIPPVDSSVAPLELRGRVAYGVLSRDAASIVIRLSDGKRVTVATTAGDAYTGRYAGKVRFVAAALPAGRRVLGGSVRDGAGRRIGIVYADGVAATTIRHPVPPGLVLETRRFSSGANTTVVTCLRPQHPLGSTGGFGLCGFPRVYGSTAFATVPCSPRRAVVYGLIPRRGHRLELALGDGSRLRPRITRLGALGRGFVASLPRRLALTALILDGHRHAAAVAPAAEQCGYDQALPGL